MTQATQYLDVPTTFSDRVRSIEVGHAIEIDETKRQSMYNQARLAFPGAVFITRKIDGKVYLKRTA